MSDPSEWTRLTGALSLGLGRQPLPAVTGLGVEARVVRRVDAHEVDVRGVRLRGRDQPAADLRRIERAREDARERVLDHASACAFDLGEHVHRVTPGAPASR